MANSKFVVDTGLVVGPLTIFASNGDIRTSGNIVYTQSGPDNPITGIGSGLPTQPHCIFLESRVAQPIMQLPPPQ